MATTTTITKMLFRRGNDADRKNTILASGEPGFTLDTKRLWIGDGITPGGYPALSAADEHLLYKPVNVPSAQKLDLNVPGVSATLAGDTTYSRMFHAVDRQIDTDFGINLNTPGHGEITYTKTSDFKIDRSADGSINIGDGAIVITKSGGQKTVSMNIDGATFSGPQYIFDNGTMTHFEDKSIDFNVGINNGAALPEGSGPTSERTGIYFAHKNYLSAGFVRIADSVADCHVLELQPTVYKKDWDSTDICTTGRGMATDGWVNNNGIQVDSNEKAPKPIRIISARPGDDTGSGYDGNAHLVLESGLMVYGPGDTTTGDYKAYKINQSLDTTSSPSFASLNIGDGSNASAIQVESGGTGNSSFNTKSVIVSHDTVGNGKLDSIPLGKGQLIIGHTTEGPKAGTIGSDTSYIEVTLADGAIQLKNKFAPNEFLNTDKTKWFSRWWKIQTDGGDVEPPNFGTEADGRCELNIKTDNDENLTTNGSGNAITISHDLVGSIIYDRRWKDVNGHDDYTYAQNLPSHVRAQKDFSGGVGGSSPTGLDDGHVFAAIKFNQAGHVVDAKTKDLDERYANIWQMGTGVGMGLHADNPIMSPISIVSPTVASDPTAAADNGAANAVVGLEYNNYGTVKRMEMGSLNSVYYTKWKTSNLIHTLHASLTGGDIVPENSDKVDNLHASSFIRSDATDYVVKDGTVAVNTYWTRKGSVGFGSAAAVDTTLKGESSEFEIKSSKNIKLTTESNKNTKIKSAGGTQSVADFEADSVTLYANNTQKLVIHKDSDTNVYGDLAVNDGGLTVAGGDIIVTGDGEIPQKPAFVGYLKGTVLDMSAAGENVMRHLTVRGDLTVQGTTTTLQSNEIEIGDRLIKLNSNFTSGTPPSTQDGGIEIERGSQTNVTLLWDEDRLAWRSKKNDPGKIWADRCYVMDDAGGMASNNYDPVVFCQGSGWSDEDGHGSLLRAMRGDNSFEWNTKTETLKVKNIVTTSGDPFATRSWVMANGPTDFVSKANGGTFAKYIKTNKGLTAAGAVSSSILATNGVHLNVSGDWATVELKSANGGFLDFGSAGEDMGGRMIYRNDDDEFRFYTAYTGSDYAGKRRVSIGADGLKCKHDIIAFHDFSDTRLKKDVSLLNSSSSLEKVLQLNGVTFKWKDEEGEAKGTQLGLIAQDVEKVVPEVIDEHTRITDPDTLYKRVDYDKLVPLLIESIKELSAKVEKLESQLK